MTITNPVSRVDAPGNGSSTQFSFNPVVITQASDLMVWMLDAAGNQTLLSQGTLATQYSVTVPGYPGTGFITYPATGGTPLPTGAKLVIKQRAPLVQQFNPQNQGPFLAGTYGQAFDYEMLVSLDLHEKIGRTIIAAETDPSNFSLSIPPLAQRINQLLGFDSLGNMTTVQPSAAPVSAAMQPIVAASSLALAIIALGILRPLVSATTFYVDNTLGTDSLNQGLSSGAGAFHTIQYALTTIQSRYVGIGTKVSVTVSVAGTGGQNYPETVLLVGAFQNLAVTLTCNSTPGSVSVNSSGTALALNNDAELTVSGGFTFATTGAGVAVSSVLHSRLFFTGGTAFQAPLGIACYATRWGYLEFNTGNCYISGGFTWFNIIQSSHGGEVRLTANAQLIFNGATSCSDAFVYVDHGAVVITAGATFNTNGQSMAGQRWRAAEDGIIQWVDGTNGTAVSIPGSTPGVDISGGQYIYGNGFLPSIVSGMTAYNMATASGTLDFGVGFVPGEIEFIASVTGGAAGMLPSVGFATLEYNGGGTAYQVTANGVCGGGFFGAQPSTNYSILFYTDSGGTNGVGIAVTSADANGNGFTVTITKFGSPTGTLDIFYKCRRGI